jgi:CrcB protein
MGIGKAKGMNILMVAVGGCLGALARYGVGLLAARLWGTGFPWGTLIVNLVGCLLIGLAFGLAGRSNLMSPQARLFFVTGFLGALTTFSSYAIETVNAAGAGQLGVVALNVAANNVAGLALAIAGLWASRFIA